jgi:regulator of cell morphogenesis and NO signaling
MIQHLGAEEDVLFPYIKKLVSAKENPEPPEIDAFGMMANPIAMMKKEHDEAGEAMKKIRRLTDDFRLPEDACATYRVLYENLEAFEKDLHKHVHLENNILFPKALELERQLNNSNSNMQPT